MDEEQIELERDIGDPVIGPVSFEVGNLAVLDCGQDWLMVTINSQGTGRHSELLPPEAAKEFIRWVKRLAKAG